MTGKAIAADSMALYRRVVGAAETAGIAGSSAVVA
jgi:hypothetical protein